MRLSKRVSAAAAVALLAGGCGGGGGDFNLPPVLDLVDEVSVSANVVSTPIAVTVADDGGANRIMLTASSMDPDLIATDAVRFDGTGRDRTLTVMPTAGRLGTTILTVTASDADGARTSATLQVTVAPQSVSFASFFRDTFNMPPDGAPRDLNSRSFDADAGPGAFDDLLMSP